MIRIVACSLILSGCAAMPSKPVVEVGGIDFPRGQVIEGLSDGSDPLKRLPLSSYDKATCFKPPSWEIFKAYVRSLEAYAMNFAKPEAKP